MSDEEVAVIEAALALDQLFWPPTSLAAVSIGDVLQATQILHLAAMALDQKRQKPQPGSDR